MPRYGDVPIKVRRALHVFYVLDTSSSMKGLPIQRLNRAMEETLDALRQVATHNANAQVKVAVLQFNSYCSWLQPGGPEDAESDFYWPDMIADGLTNMGEALDELNSKLSKDEFLKSTSGALMPVIIFMTDGYATDEYEGALARIMQNKYFREATRIGFAIGHNPDVKMITRLVGTSEAVIRTEDLSTFANLLRFVSRTASEGASVAHGVSEGFSGAQAVSQALAMAGAERTSEGTVVVPFDWGEDLMSFDAHPWEEIDPFW